MADVLGFYRSRVTLGFQGNPKTLEPEGGRLHGAMQGRGAHPALGDHVGGGGDAVHRLRGVSRHVAVVRPRAGHTARGGQRRRAAVRRVAGDRLADITSGSGLSTKPWDASASGPVRGAGPREGRQQHQCFAKRPLYPPLVRLPD